MELYAIFSPGETEKEQHRKQKAPAGNIAAGFFNWQNIFLPYQLFHTSKYERVCIFQIWITAFAEMISK